MPKGIESYFYKIDRKQDNPNKINSQSQKKRLILGSDEEDDVEPCGSVIKLQEQKSEDQLLVNGCGSLGIENPVDVPTKRPRKRQGNHMGGEIDRNTYNVKKQTKDKKSIKTSEKSLTKPSDSTIPSNSSPNTKRQPNCNQFDSSNTQSNFKRKISPTKTPEKKKKKTNSVQSPNIQGNHMGGEIDRNIYNVKKLTEDKKSIKTSEKSLTKPSDSTIPPNSSPNKKRQLNCNQFESSNTQSNFKRKISPTKTPEKKKIKINSVHSPNIQTSGGCFTQLSPTICTASPILEKNVESNLWVEKYKPLKLNQIIGQTNEKSNVNNLLNWLKAWYSNHGVGVNKKLVKPSPWAKNDNGAYFKAALLSGSPGVGKTTAAHLVCKQLGFDIVEFNASDTRSKKQLQNHVSELLSSSSLSHFLDGKSVTKKHALLMDEVDGMAGNEDRGGVQELVLLIKNAKCPVICMCNDRNHPKIRTLANYCYDLRFHKPKLEQIKAAMLSICFKEKLKIPPDTLSSIIASTDNDIRLTINHLSVFAAGKDNLNLPKKYIKMGPWDVLRKVFSSEEHKSMNINDKFDLFFYDYNISPLFVQENYLSAVPHNIKGPKWKEIERYSLAADSISIGDIVNAKIRSTNNWSLLPTQAVFSSYCPGEFLSGHVTKRINFPAWLGKFSKGNKMNRLLQEVQIHSRIKLSASKEAINLDYLITLRDSILKPLIDEGSDGVKKSLDFMNDYHLMKDDVESLNELSLWPGKSDPMSNIPSKVKSAFTRMYNKSAPTFNVTKKIKKTVEDDDLLDPDEVDVISDEGDDDDITNDALISMVKKKIPVKKGVHRLVHV